MLTLPRGLSSAADAQNALERLTPLFLADVQDGPSFDVDKTQAPALVAEDVSFEWERSESKEIAKEGDMLNGKGESATVDTPPFQIKDVSMIIQRGQLVAITGVVGSGKVTIDHVYLNLLN